MLHRRGGPAGMMAGLLLDRFPLLRPIPAHLAGIGIRPEHVDPVELTER